MGGGAFIVTQGVSLSTAFLCDAPDSDDAEC